MTNQSDSVPNFNQLPSVDAELAKTNTTNILFSYQNANITTHNISTMKHEFLLLDEQKCKLLTQDEQNQIMSDLIEYLESLEPSDYSFHGENEYGFQMSIAVSRAYGFCINLCWNRQSLWCYRDSGYVHPNLATVSGGLRDALVSRLGVIAMKWCGVK